MLGHGLFLTIFLSSINNFQANPYDTYLTIDGTIIDTITPELAPHQQMQFRVIPRTPLFGGGGLILPLSPTDWADNRDGGLNKRKAYTFQTK